MGFPGGSDGKESTCNAGDMSSIPELGNSPGGGHGNPLQYSCLKNPHGQRSLAGCSPKNRKKIGHEWTHKHGTIPEDIWSHQIPESHWELPGCSCYKSGWIPGHCMSNSNTQNSSAIVDALFQYGEQVLRKLLPKPPLIFCWLSR